MRRLVALSLAFLSLLAAAGAAARVGGAPPPFPKLPGKWSHAEINVTIKRQPHTLTLDRGTVIQASGTQLTIREAGNVNVVVPMTAQTLVVINGVPAAPDDLARKMSVDTMRVDGGPAVRVRATSK
jgi:hypothetical protein